MMTTTVVDLLSSKNSLLPPKTLSRPRNLRKPWKHGPKSASYERFCEVAEALNGHWPLLHIPSTSNLSDTASASPVSTACSTGRFPSAWK
jgi:hypothetical protein